MTHEIPIGKYEHKTLAQVFTVELIRPGKKLAAKKFPKATPAVVCFAEGLKAIKEQPEGGQELLLKDAENRVILRGSEWLFLA